LPAAAPPRVTLGALWPRRRWGQGRLNYCNDAAAIGFVDCTGPIYGGLPGIPCKEFPSTVCPAPALPAPPAPNVTDLGLDGANGTDAGNSTEDMAAVAAGAARELVLAALDMLGNATDGNGTDYNATNSTEPEAPGGPSLCTQSVGVFLRQSILVPRVWAPKSENFDNLYQAAVLLMRLFATDNMYPIFQSVMDAAPITSVVCSADGSPADNGCPPGSSVYVVANNPSEKGMPQNVILPILFIFIGNAFISQLVIGVRLVASPSLPRQRSRSSGFGVRTRIIDGVRWVLKGIETCQVW
jgi:hypothetical protein